MAARPPDAASKEPKDRSLEDPYPNTLQTVREEMDYWVTRQGEGDPGSTWEVGIEDRLTHLRSLESRYREQMGQPVQSSSRARESGEGVSVAGEQGDQLARAEPSPTLDSSNSEPNPVSASPNSESFPSRPAASTGPLTVIVLDGEELDLSEATREILRKAQSLSEESRRLVVSSSCLLFAFAETAGDAQNTSWFVRDALSRDGNYEREFKRFLSDSTSSSEGKTIEGLPGRFSPNALATIEYAAKIASRVGNGSRHIGARHLFGALLVAPWADQLPVARKRLQSFGFDLPKLADDFLQFLSVNVPSDNQQEWRVLLKEEGDANLSSRSSASGSDEKSPLLPGPQPKTRDQFVAGTPGYTSEFCGLGESGTVTDELGVDDLARLLAELIVLRETKLPLAIGLFGNWGSGKSHFMNLMDRHIKLLATKNSASLNSDATYGISDSRWCAQIVPIYFNAWHYSDSNLWASLVTEVFDKLFDHLKPKRNELELLQSQLRDAGGVTALAVEEVRNASESVRQATVALQEARGKQNDAKQAVEDLRAGLREGLRTLLPELNSDQNRKRVFDLLGVSAESATLSRLIAKREELSSIAGKFLEIWRRATGRSGLKRRLAWLAGTVLALVLIRFVIPFLSPQLGLLLSRMGPRVKSLLVFLIGASGWMIPAIDQVQKGLTQLDEWEKRAEAAQSTMPENVQLIAAKNAMSSAEARASAAEVALQEAKSKELHLTQALNDLRPERRLSSFIEARARSADYRGQLGLVSLARRDFEQLSSIFTDKDALQEKIKSSPEQAEGLINLSASIDRVVLFIDDLDRCDPEKVVDVLQAVHLLLAYPLFAVVVGVDQRCLKQSLRIRFKGLLTPVPENGNRPGERSADLDEIPATPLDYLEKIFHVPFHIPPMSEEGFARLVEKLTQPARPLRPSTVQSLTLLQAGSEAGNPPDLPLAPNEKGASSQQADAPAEERGVEIASEMPSPASTTTNQPTPQPPAAIVGSVPLYLWERMALRDFHSLICTPRGATRFLNTYRLVRAALPAQEWERFRGDDGGQKEFLVAMLLLAVAAGQPAVARDWFKALRELQPGQLPLAVTETAESRPEWNRFVDLYSRIAAEATSLTSSRILAKWLDRVERFTF